MRRSTLRMVSTNGIRRKKPGPRASTRRPRRKITPRSYSCTIFTAAVTTRNRTMAMTPTTTNVVIRILSNLSCRTAPHSWIQRPGQDGLPWPLLPACAKHACADQYSRCPHQTQRTFRYGHQCWSSDLLDRTVSVADLTGDCYHATSEVANCC